MFLREKRSALKNQKIDEKRIPFSCTFIDYFTPAIDQRRSLTSYSVVFRDIQVICSIDLRIFDFEQINTLQIKNSIDPIRSSFQRSFDSKRGVSQVIRQRLPLFI